MTDWPWWRLAVVVMVVNSEGAYDGWLDWMGGFLLAVHLCAPFYVSHRSALHATIGQHINTLAISLPHMNALMRSGDAAQPIGNLRSTT